ncbi:unnamed protein product [Acanthoscelides obtectus]|uniref:Dopa decarboxylase n=1 Tax=Acanthoscelides obtectus TaxID=200917 RepID=A0A9P0JTF3_ACAOB|nr:unnamed protein product [Acanthoscelides obtectus]CAK1637478.1 Aromatic-L-amino-acid decarboxylase [Acanthoscelides obtectus]
MDVDEFREFGKAAVDYIADYFQTIRDRPVLPSVHPGYLGELLPKEPPQTGESWQEVLQDVDRIIMPGLTHWHSPKFHAYYPTAHSFPAVVGEMMSAGFGCVGLNWVASPAYTELEVVMMNWLGKLLGLPEEFLNCSDGPGGGVIQVTLRFLLCLFWMTWEVDPTLKEADIKGKLVAYSSDQSNSSVEKSGLLGSMPMRLLPADKEGKHNQCRLRGSTLREAVEKDKADGLIPCCVVASLGTTGTCSIDELEELGIVCKENDIWLHVDAAYAGAALVCPEYRHLMKGVEYTDSFNFNPHKWFLTNSDCSAMWFRNTKDAEEAFKVKSTIQEEPQYEYEIEHWQIPNCRRFRALKLWFVMRIYGVQGIQKHIRHQVGLAKYFEKLVRNDERYEVLISCLGVVCFRLKGEDQLTQKLLDRIAERKKLFIMPYYIQSKLVIRFVICSRLTEREDIDYAWNEIISLTPVTRKQLSNAPIQTVRRTLSLKNAGSIVNKGIVTDINDKIKVELFI